MLEELSDYYFLKALTFAQNADLTKAVEYAAVLMGIDGEREAGRNLAGLCYYKLGNYTMAEYCFQNSNYFTENIKDMLLKKKEQLHKINQIAEKEGYKKAIRQLEEDKDKNISEYNYLGCLYALLNKKQKAAACFLEVLKEDSGNQDALYYLKNLQYIRKKRWWNQ